MWDDDIRRSWWRQAFIQRLEPYALPSGTAGDKVGTAQLWPSRERLPKTPGRDRKETRCS